MRRRRVLQAMGGIGGLSMLGAQPAAASPTLVNAEVRSSGAVVATGDDFLIAGLDLTVAGGAYHEDGAHNYVIYNDGYSGTIAENRLSVTAADDETSGVRLDGGTVDVLDNAIEAADDVGGQFVAVAATGGAAATVRGNQLLGAHRVGVLARGAGTSLDLSRNEIVGPGPRTSGWADNGVQLDGGATGQVKANLIADHWYVPNTFQSAGLLAFADDVVAQRNDLTNNDVQVGIYGDRNNVVHNALTVPDPTDGTYHYGVYELGGVDNGIRQNEITTTSAADGLYGLIVLGENAKLIGNDLSGWVTPIFDGGDETKLPAPFAP